MTEERITEAVDDIVNDVGDEVDVSRDDVESKLNKLVGEYTLPLDEAKRSVINDLIGDSDVDRADMQSADGVTLVNEINEDEEWINVEVTFDEEWEPRSDSIAQVGLVGDASGRNKFVSFETSDLPELEVGESYRLESVVTDEYEGDYSIKLNSETEIIQLDEDIEVGDDKEVIEGALVNIRDGEGLIKRCPEDDCTRTVGSGSCQEHGDVDGAEDLRVIANIDDGEEVTAVVFDREQTEALTGITLDEAQEIAEDVMDMGAVLREFASDIRGEFYRIEGADVGDYFLVDGFEEVSNTAPDVEETLVKARSI
jgi:replication factor A1